MHSTGKEKDKENLKINEKIFWYQSEKVFKCTEGNWACSSEKNCSKMLYL